VGSTFANKKSLKGLSEPQKEKIITVLTIQNFFANTKKFKKST